MSKYVFVPDNITPLLWPLTIREVRQRHTSISIPEFPTDDQLSELGYYVLYLQDKPVYDIKTQKIERNNTPQKLIDKWTMVWDTIALSQGEIDDVELFKWNNVRDRRNLYLEKSDWTQLSDIALDANTVSNFVTYRQILRDIPQTQSDPWNITWPDIPPKINE
jgi:hypothetical protein